MLKYLAVALALTLASPVLAQSSGCMAGNCNSAHQFANPAPHATAKPATHRARHRR